MQLYNIDYISWHTEHDGIAECDLSDTSMSKWFRVITVIGEIKLRPTINTTTKPPWRMMVQALNIKKHSDTELSAKR